MAISKNIEVGAVGNYDAWTLTAGADKVVAVQLPDDEGTTMLSASTLNVRESYTLKQSDIPNGIAKVNSIDIVARHRNNSGGADPIRFKPFARLGGTDADYTEVVPAATFGTHTETGVARPGGGAWTAADLLTLEIGILESVDSANLVQVTTLYMVLNYKPDVGAESFLIG